MIPTGTQVLAAARGWLDDDAGGTFTDIVLNTAFQSAYDTLFAWMLVNQLPRLKNITSYTLPVLTTSLTPLTAGIADFGEFELLEERLSGSTDRFRRVYPLDQLSQHPPNDIIGEFVWRLDTFEFVGATTQRELRLTYFSSATAPDLTTSPGKATSIGVDGSLTFLGKMTAANAGPRKGYDVDSARLRMEAVGPRFDEGLMGGDLWSLLQPMIRNVNKVQLAPKPFSVYGRRRDWRFQPNVSVQQPAGVGTAPAQFSSQTGTITGTIDGTNATFYLSYPVASAVIFRSGVLMTQPTDVIWGANQLVFQAGQIPQVGDVLTVEGWA